MLGFTTTINNTAAATTISTNPIVIQYDIINMYAPKNYLEFLVRTTTNN